MSNQNTRNSRTPSASLKPSNDIPPPVYQEPDYMSQSVDDTYGRAIIKVLGIGGGGSNAVRHMANNHVEGVDFFFVNTDAQALSDVPDHTRVQIGEETTRGLGAGAKSEVGKQSAIESQDSIKAALSGSDMVFLTAGMGGGTGTGAAPVVAELSRNMNILTVGVVTTPFSFEGPRRRKEAMAGINELKRHVDSLIVIPNDRLLTVLGNDITVVDAFAKANDILLNAVQGISDLIMRHGMMNVDFADVKTVMSEMGVAMMGTGVGYGEERAEQAVYNAIHSPLLNRVHLHDARGILVNITSGHDFELSELHLIGEIVHEMAAEDASVIIGSVIEPSLGDELQVTLLATGLSDETFEEVMVPEVRRKRRSDEGGQTHGMNAPGGRFENGGRRQQSPVKPEPDRYQDHRPQGRRSAVPQSSSRHEDEVHRRPARQYPQEQETVKRKDSGNQLSDRTDMLDIPAFLRRHNR